MDKFTISLETVRKDIQDLILTIGVITEDLDGRGRDAESRGKRGFFLTLEETEWYKDTLCRSQAGLLAKFDTLLESAKHEKLQNRILEASQDGFLRKFANDEEMRDAVLQSLSIPTPWRQTKAA
jgi:hypothetical protein